jgi:hypothetical protein
MTAAELIAALRAVAPETRIIAPGRRRAFTTLVAVRLVPIKRDAGVDPWEGDYSEADPPGQERALLIGRAGIDRPRR